MTTWERIQHSRFPRQLAWLQGVLPLFVFGDVFRAGDCCKALTQRGLQAAQDFFGWEVANLFRKSKNILLKCRNLFGTCVLAYGFSYGRL